MCGGGDVKGSDHVTGLERPVNGQVYKYFIHRLVSIGFERGERTVLRAVRVKMELHF